MQFLSTGTNRRTDAYGGSVNNRIRFVVEALEAMIAAAGSSGSVGMKISPAMPFNDCTDDNPVETYTTLVKAVSPLNLGYLHVLQTTFPNTFELLRPLFKGPFAAGGGFDRESGNAMLASGLAPTSSCSASCSRRTPICRRASPRARRSRPGTPRRSTRPARRATPTTPRCNAAART